jgi:ADP-heptose:LPS heptosyltransferase
MRINVNFFKGFGDALLTSAALKQLKEDEGYTIAVGGLGAKAIYQNNQDVQTEPFDAPTYTPTDLLLKQANKTPIHQLQYPIAYFNLALGLKMELKYNHCFLYLTPQEQQPTHPRPYILINTEVNNNFTIKKYHRWQEVIDLLAPHIDIIHVGLKRDYKDKVINMTAQTHLRQLFNLVYNAEANESTSFFY